MSYSRACINGYNVWPCKCCQIRTGSKTLVVDVREVSRPRILQSLWSKSADNNSLSRLGACQHTCVRVRGAICANVHMCSRVRERVRACSCL